MLKRILSVLISKYTIVILFFISGTSLGLQGNWQAASFACIILLSVAVDEQRDELIRLLELGNELRDEAIRILANKLDNKGVKA